MVILRIDIKFEVRKKVHRKLTIKNNMKLLYVVTLQENQPNVTGCD